MWVKVCGITNAEDMAATIRAGADAIGLVLVERSPRRIDIDLAAELAAAANGQIETVLLVEAEATTALEAAQQIGATGIQPYGPNGPATALLALDNGLAVLQPIAVGNHVDLSQLVPGAIPLLDTSINGQTGGTGQPFAWNLARGVPEAVIAGGLNSDNVGEAIASARPRGVDASSGLEAEVGRKDHGKVAAFVAAARNAAKTL